MVYMDNAATTKPYKSVMETYMNTGDDYYFNTASIHTKGREAARLLEAARAQVKGLIGLEEYDCIFTSGATESNNLAIQGIIEKKKRSGTTILVSEIEHPSIMNTLEAMKEEVRVKYIRTTAGGMIDLAHLEELIDEDVIFVTIMAVNNIIGSVQPIQEVARLLEGHPKAHFHVDATQAVGKIQMDYRGVDSISFSSHKFHGIKGIGALLSRDGGKLSPIIYGGGHEYGKRSGTVNLPGAVAMARAMRISGEAMKENTARLSRYNEQVQDKVRNLKSIHIHPGGVPHILNISFIGAQGEVVVNALGKRGIMVSTTSACASKLRKLNETLSAIGSSKEKIEGSIRISFGNMTAQAEVDQLCDALGAVYEEIKEVLE
ncbi:cysteine desulfurase family protein [Salinicoccus jeotgali]|uniref:Cysteine desulfurase family protein n=2 Tax=Salinicoccus jeotgali TaxID=381634 RepID=A0ABP7ESP2_9STAP